MEMLSMQIKHIQSKINFQISAATFFHGHFMVFRHDRNIVLQLAKNPDSKQTEIHYLRNNIISYAFHGIPILVLYLQN